MATTLTSEEFVNNVMLYLTAPLSSWQELSNTAKYSGLATAEVQHINLTVVLEDAREFCFLNYRDKSQERFGKRL